MLAESYVFGLALSNETAPVGRIKKKGGPTQSSSIPANLKAAVDAGSILSFVSGVDAAETSDVIFSVQLASRAADASFSRFKQTRDWYGKYNEVLENVGWTTEQFAFASHGQGEGNFRMDKSALAIISAIATGNQLQAITASITALEKMAEGDGAITMFDFHAAKEGSGNFQLGAVQKASNNSLSMALGAFYFRSTEQRRKFLFFQWGQNEVEFWTAAQKMTLNIENYAKVRKAVKTKLGEKAIDFVANLNISL